MSDDRTQRARSRALHASVTIAWLVVASVACVGRVKAQSRPSWDAGRSRITDTAATSADRPAHSPDRSVTVAGLTSIHDIQGAAHLSPLNGLMVTTSGIVTAVDSNGFYLQEPDADADADKATSEGIFVFTSSPPVPSVGDLLEVTATVSEYRPGASGLTITQLMNPAVVVLSTGNPLPAPIVIGSAGRQPPTTVIDDDSRLTIDIETDPSAVFDAEHDGVDFYESLEGMRVRVENALAVAPTRTFGSGGPGNVEIYTVPDDGLNAFPRTVQGGVHIEPDDFNPERVILNNHLARLPVVDLGARFTDPIDGVMSYNYGKFLLLPTQAPAAPIPGSWVPEKSAIVGSASILTIASYNVENLDPNDADGDADVADGSFQRHAEVIVNNLNSPDIIGLQEIQDNSGGVDDGTVDASLTYQLLIDAIVAAGGPQYDVRQIDPVNNADGGQPGGNIRTGYLFNPERVTFVDRGNAGPLDETVFVAGPDGLHLSLSPGRVYPTRLYYEGTRKPLAGEFLFGKERVFVINNHFSARLGDDPLFGFDQPPVSYSDDAHLNAIRGLFGFTPDRFNEDATTNVVILGDMNEFEFSDAVTLLTGTELTNLAWRVDPADRYSYIFEGNSEALDHILVNRHPAFNLSWTADYVHVNTGAERQVSDHDPVLAGLNFDTPICYGDLNNDRRVTRDDYNMLRYCLVGPGETRDYYWCVRPDFDGDGDVDLRDLSMYLPFLNTPCDGG